MIIPPLTNVSSSRGAPMGRSSVFSDKFDAPVAFEVHLLPLVDDCYDEGGAYWGMNAADRRMFRVTGYGPQGINDFFFCAADEAAVQKLTKNIFTNATFPRSKA